MKYLFTFLLFLCYLLASCGDDSATNAPDTGVPLSSSPAVSSSSGDGINVETGRVHIFNESSYQTIVYKDFFPPAGIALCTLSAGGSKTIDTRASDKDGIGSTFPIEYKYLIADDFDLAGGEVWANGIDPNVQINTTIEANKTQQIQIPQPQNLVFPNAYLRILNSASLQFELNHLNTAYKQSGNGNLSVPSGKIGLYEIDATSDGIVYSDWFIRTTFETVPIPDFTAKSGTIYHLTYTGTSISLDSEQKIVFNK